MLVLIRTITASGYRALIYLFLYVSQTGVPFLCWDLLLKEWCMMCMTFLRSYQKFIMAIWIITVLTIFMVSIGFVWYRFVGWVNICSIVNELMLDSSIMYYALKIVFQWSFTIFLCGRLLGCLGQVSTNILCKDKWW